MILRRCLLCLLLLGVGSVTVLLLLLLLLLTFPQKRYNTQEERKTHLQETCNATSWRGLEELSESELEQFIVDDKHGIIYCYVPQVACTNWKRVFFVLSKGEPYVDVMSISEKEVHTHRLLTFLNSYPMAERKARLKHYTKFLFVCDPFVRLISAYRDKIGGTNKAYFKAYAPYMLQHYANMSNPPEKAEDAFEAGIRPSFNNFIKFLIDPEPNKNWKFDYHWRPMHRLCHPCSIQ